VKTLYLCWRKVHSIPFFYVTNILKNLISAKLKAGGVKFAKIKKKQQDAQSNLGVELPRLAQKPQKNHRWRGQIW